MRMTTLAAPQRSEAWFAARRGLPTCSRFDRILTAVKGEPSKAQSALIDELIAESICPPEDGLIRNVVTPEMEYGMKLEAEARCAYEMEFAPGPVSEVGFVLHASGLFGGSPDALVGEDGGCEIKCPSPAVHVGYYRAGVLPGDYRCQVHGYMAVTGRAWWSFFSYARHFPPFHLRVMRDDFTAKLEAELLAFCKRYNEARAKFDLAPIGSMSPQTEAA
jgi:hypothetical protein